MSIPSVVVENEPVPITQMVPVAQPVRMRVAPYHALQAVQTYYVPYVQRAVQVIPVQTLQPLALYQHGYNLYLVNMTPIVYERPAPTGWLVVGALVGLLTLLLVGLFLLFVAGLIMTSQPLFY